MLHLFYVYSGIVARMVPHVIQHLNLNPEEVLILLDRSQTRSLLPENLAFDHAGFFPFRNRWRFLTSDWLRLHKNRKRITSLSKGAQFHLYTPSPSDPKCQQLIHHPLCVSYYLLEEGFGAYSAPGESPARTTPPSIMERIRPGARLRSLWYTRPVTTDYPIWLKKYSGAIGSNRDTFPNFPPPVINLNIALFAPTQTPFTHLLVVDDLSVFSEEMQYAYLSVLERLIRTVPSTGAAWAYKLHPRCETWQWLRERMSKIFTGIEAPNFSFQKLAPDVCIEEIGLNPNVTTYGYLSVGLYYIFSEGGRILSLKDEMEKELPAIASRWRQLFPDRLERLVAPFPMYNPVHTPQR